ncbi:hypothetical protein L2E82_34589 [Cichorium intybus]|uniref:Uncharacterized protein n=1 Tax=Cichorium intybus TaxID=13427 RepID=A0ACB9BME3_CICIN|nr:hypothetical protein L2E82_34589 [Cichorium intybus]
MIVDPDEEPPLLYDENMPPPCHCKRLAKSRESWKIDNPARRFWNYPQSLRQKKKRLEDEQKWKVAESEMTKKLEKMQAQMVELIEQLWKVVGVSDR